METNLRVGDNAGDPRRDNFVQSCRKWNDAMLFDAKMGVGRKGGLGAETGAWVLQVRLGAIGGHGASRGVHTS